MEPTTFSEDPGTLLRELANRMRILEERYNLSRERIFLINQNMIDQYKKISDEVRTINEDLREIKSDLSTMKDLTRNTVKELEFFARKENLKVLEKYINLWNPLNFVTKEEVLELIKTKKKVKNAKPKKKRRSTSK